MLGKIIIAGWVLFFAFVLVTGIFPKLIFRIPHLELAPFFVFPFVFVSIVYGIVWLYRQGMKHARGK